MNVNWAIALTVLGGLLLYSSGDEASSAKETAGSSALAAGTEMPSMTVVAEDTVHDRRTPSMHVADLQYNGDQCTIDCSGHEAGANWAEEQAIDDPDDCGGNSHSFIEGCMTYVEQKMEEHESGDAP